MSKSLFPKGTKKIAKRIIQAAKNKERVIIFGDTDLDGIASTIILKELFEILNPLYEEGEDIRVYFPDREEEGYGISQLAFDFFADAPPALFFTVDCGITNFKEIEKAKKLGFETIIIDHHQELGRLPKADLIVDPKQKGETYPFTDFAAAGLVYKVAEATLDQLKYPKIAKEKLIELAALATLSDQMPLKEDNRAIVDQGMNALLTTQRPGLLALIEIGEADVQIDNDVFQKIIAPLNSSRLRNHVAESYLLLVEKSAKRAKSLAQKLIRQTKEKKALILDSVEELRQKFDKEKTEELIIFEVNKYWPVPTLGVIASKLLHSYPKPIFLFKKKLKESAGSVRLPKEFDGVDALTSCKKLLITYGGHAPACGCRLKNENLPKLKKCLEKYFSKKMQIKS